MPKLAKTAPKPKQPRYHRYAVRIGRCPGIYASYKDGAQPQVHEVTACHMGFSKRQCELALHHMYMQQVLDSSQISKLAAGSLLLTPDGTPAPYTPTPYTYYDVDGVWPYGTPQEAPQPPCSSSDNLPLPSPPAPGTRPSGTAPAPLKTGPAPHACRTSTCDRV